MSLSSIQAFDIHGVHVRVETENSALTAGVAELLQQFPRVAPVDARALVLTYRGGARKPDFLARELAPCRGELLFSSSWDNAYDLARLLGIRLEIYRQDGQLLWDYHENGCLRLDKSRGMLEGYLAESIDLHPMPLTSFFFLLPLSELLASRGLHMIHAAALEREGRGVLIPGVSGSGKSTSCVSLMRAGYRCLSDDKPFLRSNGNGIELLAFPESIDVTDRTVSFFPELRVAPSQDLKAGYRKKQFRADAIYPDSTTNAVRPALILFPQISGESRSRLEKLSKIRALEAILPHGLLVLDAETSGHQFDLLARLIESAECYRLSFGRDVLELPSLVDALLE